MTDLNGVKKIYFVGIGGIAMSAAACLAKSYGYEVSGSDSKEIYDPSKSVLEKEKISYAVGYKESNVAESGADLFVISAGEDLSNPELRYIIEKNLPKTSFPELLYELSRDRLRIVVTGTHGKSTTTALIGHIAKNLDDSSFLAGAVLQNYSSNFHSGDGHYFVFEGDEYKSMHDDPTPKFSYLKPDILVLTNLEYDHPDLFPDFESLKLEFADLLQAMPEDGVIVYNADDANLAKLVHESNVTSVSFGIENEADFKVETINFEGEYTSFEVSNKHTSNVTAKLLGVPESYKTQLPGRLNVYNALGAIALFRTLGFSQEQIALDLLSFLGIKRRFELVGTKNSIRIIDDYAHHATAIRETLRAAKSRYPGSRVWAVFEPHTFSRTKATLGELAESFDDAEQVLISEIYPARETAKNATISSAQVIEAINEHNLKAGIPSSVRLVSDKEQALKILKSEAKENDVIIVMAVGNFNRLAYELRDEL